ncbi:hypothetical protein EX895_005970 [Sporisorium graminicola]|uniref:Uncharacterized protein n=1 Tax=Sporisorium graminicola TaxID=280036 RepID=A0A4U7KL36_9BASI|nr:hypothetical protein EX895_005970 [Sporisorium graminicola]TKY84890.1 hypothetical protein EX895_005970 [Sporisorium graminicola]
MASPSVDPTYGTSAAADGPSSIAFADTSSRTRPVHVGRERVTPVQLDQFFGNKLVDTRHPNVWKLPDQTIVASSSWFDESYLTFAGFGPGSSKPIWKDGFKVIKSNAEIEAIWQNRWRLFRARVTAYKVTFEEPGQGPAGEVLIRFFTNDIRHPDFDVPENSIAVFQSGGGGRALAFLGLYHCPKTMFDKMYALPTTQPFKVLVSNENRGIILVPQPRTA